MTMKLLCLDIIPDGKDVEIVKRIEASVARRCPSRGTIYCLRGDKWSCFRGGESTLLTHMARRRVRGEIISVDGIFLGGFNVATRVEQEEAERLRHNPDFGIRCEVDIPKGRY